MTNFKHIGDPRAEGFRHSDLRNRTMSLLIFITLQTKRSILTLIESSLPVEWESWILRVETLPTGTSDELFPRKNESVVCDRV